MTQTQGVSQRIGDRDFEVYMMPPKTARRHILKINQAVLPLIAKVFDEGRKSSKGKKGKKPTSLLDSDLELESIAMQLVERASPDYVEELMDDLALATICAPGGQLSKSYDLVFQGHPGHQIQWFVHAMKVNFGDFIEESGLGSLLEALPEMKESESQSTSIIGDTDS